MIHVERLAAELAELVRVFPAHPERAHLLTMYDRDDEDRPDWDAFEAFVRAHKQDRLAMPAMQLIAWRTRTIKGSFRRFAYFVPTILAACVSESTDGWLTWRSASSWLAEARSGESFYHAEYGSPVPRDFTEDERRAMSAFFAAALRETVHGPSPDEALDVLVCAAAFDAHPRDVLLAWIALGDVDAEAALARAVPEVLGNSRHTKLHAAVADERVRAALEQRFLASTDPKRAAALSELEAVVAVLVTPSG